MPSDEIAQATHLLNEVTSGDASATERLFKLLYGDLRALAARLLKQEKPGHTLQPTALVHEVYMKLVDQSRVDWKGKTHFFAVGAQVMRRVLVDHARARQRAKRGGGRQRILLDQDIALGPEREEDLLALEDALSRLADLDPRQATIVEMRFFGGLTVAEVAEVLGVSKRTVENDWTVVRAWLRRELSQDKTS